MFCVGLFVCMVGLLFVYGIVRTVNNQRGFDKPKAASRLPAIGTPLDDNTRSRLGQTKTVSWVFAIGMCCLAIYHGIALTLLETQGRPVKLWEGFAAVYSAAGKWGVIGLDLVFAAPGFAIARRVVQVLRHDPNRTIASPNEYESENGSDNSKTRPKRWHFVRWVTLLVTLMSAFLLLDSIPLERTVRTEHQVRAEYPLFVFAGFAIAWTITVVESFRLLADTKDRAFQQGIGRIVVVLLMLLPLSMCESMLQRVTVSRKQFESDTPIVGGIFGNKVFPFDQLQSITRETNDNGDEVLRFFSKGLGYGKDVRMNALVRAVRPDLKKRAQDQKVQVVGF